MSHPTLKQPSIGIDVSKKTLDVATPDGVHQVANNAEGHSQLAASLAKHDPHVVVVEATGGYERGLVVELVAAGLPVALVNPKQARDFAKATGQLAKTDAIDARVLARLGEALDPEVRKLPPLKLIQRETARITADSRPTPSARRHAHRRSQPLAAGH